MPHILHEPTGHEEDAAGKFRASNIISYLGLAVEVVDSSEFSVDTFETFGKEDHMISETSAAKDASAIAFPWKISASALALSQTIENESVSGPNQACTLHEQLVMAKTAYAPSTAGLSEGGSFMSAWEWISQTIRHES